MPETYYKLAKYETRSFTFKDGKTAYPTDWAASKAAVAMGPGRYRISEVAPNGTRTDQAPFDVTGVAEAAPAAPKKYPKHATRPMGGRPH